MPVVLNAFTANAPPLLSASLVAAQSLQSQVCTVDSTLPAPGRLAIQGGRQGQPNPLQPVLSRGRWRPCPDQLHGPGI